jgi:hypothetical protein
LLKNRWTQAWAEPGAPAPLPNLPVGQIVGRMNEIRPVAEVVASLLTEIEDARARLQV